MKTYLGDGCYADFDGYHVKLTTENGIRTTNVIFLDVDTLDAFLTFVQEVAAKRKAGS